MKLLVFTIAILASISCYAQKTTSYKTSNGVTYNIGDSVRLATGTGTNGKFILMSSSWSGGEDSMANNLMP